MQNFVIIEKNKFTLIGLKVRTSNALEADPKTARISNTIQNYYSINKNESSVVPMYSVYTEYVSDYTGEYNYFFGRSVFYADEVPQDGFVLIEIPAQKYLHYKTSAGAMPDIVIDAWRMIWDLENNSQLPSKRLYKADFEVYGESYAPQGKTIVDLYIGIE